MQAIVKQQQAEADKQKRIIDADASAYEVKAAADAKAHQIEVQGKLRRAQSRREATPCATIRACRPWSRPRNGTACCPPPWCRAIPLPFLNIAK